jgi:hypothetical protein
MAEELQGRLRVGREILTQKEFRKRETWSIRRRKE